MAEIKIEKVWNIMLCAQWCATNNYANIFSKVIDDLLRSDKLSHNDLLNILDCTISIHWHEGTVLVEQRLAKFPQEDNKERLMKHAVEYAKIKRQTITTHNTARYRKRYWFKNWQRCNLSVHISI